MEIAENTVLATAVGFLGILAMTGKSQEEAEE
jgi:hypothetical protein